MSTDPPEDPPPGIYTMIAKYCNVHIIVTPRLPQAYALGLVQMQISGDLQEFSDKFPTPEDDFMLQIS